MKTYQFPREFNILIPVASKDLVRLGSKGDGGYVINKSLIDLADTVICMGVSFNWSFESSFNKLNPRVKVHAYDHTVSNLVFFNAILKSFVKLLIGKDGFNNILTKIKAFLSYNRFFVNKNVHFKKRIYERKQYNFDASISDIFLNAMSNKVFIKMDIEGGEYRVIDSLLLHSDDIIGMAIEFHDINPLKDTFLKNIKSILKFYNISHIHINNFSLPDDNCLPDLLEISFIRKDLQDADLIFNDKIFPLEGLDFPSVKGRDDVRFKFNHF
jgi:hypothetical protein